MRLFLWILGLAGAANGLWMIVAPELWYHELPAGVPDTGPLNLHFVRDIGAAFITFGLALCVAGEVPKHRRPAVTITALFYGLHALIHIFDLIAGRLPFGHWLEDLPGVFAPAILMGVMSMPRWWRGKTA